MHPSMRALFATALTVLGMLGACAKSEVSIPSPSPDGGPGGVSDNGGSGDPNEFVDGTSTDRDAARTEDAASSEDVRVQNDPACPASYAAAEGNHCNGGSPTCTYDEGWCTCAGYCGGAPPLPDTDYNHWKCTPKRTDGCPDQEPAADSPCSSPGKTCEYTPCCSFTAKCTDGKWVTSIGGCPA